MEKTLKKFLVEEMRYVKLSKEYGLFFRNDSEGYDIIAVCVDDLFLVSTDITRLERTKNEIKRKWEATDQGGPSYYWEYILKRIGKQNRSKFIKNN